MILAQAKHCTNHTANSMREILHGRKLLQVTNENPRISTFQKHTNIHFMVFELCNTPGGHLYLKLDIIRVKKFT